MTDRPISIHIDSSEKRPDIPDLDQAIRCADHPDLEPEMSFGLAGGGFGMYTYCPACGRILSKDVESEEEG